MAMARAVVDALDSHTFVLCNVKGPMWPAMTAMGGEGGAIQRIDQMVGYLYENLGILTCSSSPPTTARPAW